MKPKVCKDCKHLAGFNSICRSTNNGFDLVSGTALHWAREARNSENLCGLSARWFEEKPQSDLSTLEKIVNKFHKWLGS